MVERVDRHNSLSKGERIHNRNVLAAARQSGDPLKIREAESMVSAVRIHARQTEKDSRQLTGIDTKLEKTDLSPQDQAELRIEKIWHQFQSGELDAVQREQKLFDLLNGLDDGILKWLSEPTGLDTSGNPTYRLASIRDRVIPPRRR